MRSERGSVKVRSRSWLLVPTFAGLALAGAGCGGGGGSCGVTPCGGNPTGTWLGVSACLDKATLNMEFLTQFMGSCPAASLGSVTMLPNGLIALAADMTFTGTLTLSSSFDLVLPLSCTNGATCAQLTQTLQSTVGTDGILSVTCAGSTSCTCTVLQDIDVVNDTGTWSTSGTTLSFVGASSSNSGAYCVQGSTLHLVDTDSSAMMKVVGDIVLQAMR
jgi:hypothetical protein